MFWWLRGRYRYKENVPSSFWKGMYALLIAGILAPAMGVWSLAVGAAVFFGEGPGWKPKYYKDDGDLWTTVKYGALIAGVGAVLVPLAVWLHKKTLQVYPDLEEPVELWFDTLGIITAMLVSNVLVLML